MRCVPWTDIESGRTPLEKGSVLHARRFDECEQKEIKKAYRKLAIRLHPDKCTGMQVLEKFPDEQVTCDVAMNRVNLAYEILGEEDKRIMGCLSGSREVINATRAMPSRVARALSKVIGAARKMTTHTPDPQYDLGGMESVKKLKEEDERGGQPQDPFAAMFGGGLKKKQ